MGDWSQSQTDSLSRKPSHLCPPLPPPRCPRTPRLPRRSGTSASSPTSTTASRPWPTGCSRSPASSTRGRCARSTSTGWTSSGSGASRSSRQAVRMPWESAGRTYALNMIDTPGHVDFTYEVSRSLAACEGAVLLVDAAQGIEAQTLANLYLAMENDLTIIPVLNKIDLPAAQPEKYAEELARLIGCAPDDVHQVSGKTGVGVEPLLDEIVRLVPAPGRRPRRARPGDDLRLRLRHLPRRRDLRPGHRRQPQPARAHRHDVDQGHPRAPRDRRHLARSRSRPRGSGSARSATSSPASRTSASHASATPSPTRRKPATEALGGYRDPKPMVFSGLYPIDGSDYPDLRDALDKLKLNDAALVYEPETSAALGFGFRCGFLGLLHLEIVRERLEREFGLDLISTQPNVVYEVWMEDGTSSCGDQPERVPGRQGRRGPRARRPGHDPRAERLHRRDHGALPEPARGRCAGWTTSPRTGSRCATPCRSPRSSSTSSTS